MNKLENRSKSSNVLMNEEKDILGKNKIEIYDDEEEEEDFDNLSDNDLLGSNLSKQTVKKDLRNIIFLLFLYFLQGIDCFKFFKICF